MTPYVDLETLLKREELDLVETLKDDEDHQVHLVTRRGQSLVLKVNVHPELQRGLEREVSATLAVRALEQVQEHWSVGTSAPVAVGEGWLLREHVARPALLEGEQDGDRAARVGQALADLDRLAPDPATSCACYRDPAGEPVAGPQDRASEVARWVSALEADGALGDLGARDLVERLGRLREQVKPGFEVWDVKPDDFLDLSDGRVGVYDLEWAHPFGRRYFDLARLLARLAVQLDRAQDAAALLRAFLDRSPLPLDEVDRAARGVLAEALLSELYDARDDERRELARSLLRDVLDRGASALL